jgi:DNA invertase Pin-like site-specific DNA recombinase
MGRRKMKTAFSYLRFSDKKQAKGDSRRRQLEWGPAVCAAKGWALDDSLRLQDLGVSAFRGRNAATGALAAFLRAVRAGKVRPGDVLLVESLDRLSREDIDPAWELFRSILKSGVEIYTREPERHYIPADLNSFGTRIEVQAYMLRAYNESATKSMRGRSYWEALRAKLADKRPIHKLVPAWLRLSADRRQIEVIPEAAKAIKLIYRWAAQGLGLNPITARLNREGIPPIGNNTRRKVFKDTWRRSYVAKILADRAVLGEFQPHIMKEVPVDPEDPNGPKRWRRVPHGDPIPGYFPQIITEDEWYRVRQAVKERGKELGPKGVGIASLFTGLIRDARDGQTMHLIYSGSSRKNNTRVVVSYGCRNGEPGSVHMPFPYDAIERAFLAMVRELKASDVLGDKVHEREEEMIALKGKRQELDRKITAVQQRAREEKGIEALLSLLETLDKDRKAVNAQLERLQAEIAHQQPTALRDTQSLVELLSKTEGEERKELRTKIKARIKQLVSEVWVLVWDVTPGIRAAEVHVFFHTGRVRGILLAWSRRGRYRGLITSFGAVLVQPGEAVTVPELRQYRSDPGVRAFFDRHQDILGPSIQAALDAVGEAHEAVGSAEAQPGSEPPAVAGDEVEIMNVRVEGRSEPIQVVVLMSYRQHHRGGAAGA